MKKTTLLVCAGVFASIIGGSTLSAEEVYNCPEKAICNKSMFPPAPGSIDYLCDNGAYPGWHGLNSIPATSNSPEEFTAPISMAAVEGRYAYCLYQRHGYDIKLFNHSINKDCKPLSNPARFECN